MGFLAAVQRLTSLICTAKYLQSPACTELLYAEQAGQNCSVLRLAADTFTCKVIPYNRCIWGREECFVKVP